MAETLIEVFIIKATSKFTDDIHYVKIDDGYVELVDHNSNATIYDDYESAEAAIEEFCDGEETQEYTVASMMISFEEYMTMH